MRLHLLRPSAVGFLSQATAGLWLLLLVGCGSDSDAALAVVPESAGSSAVAAGSGGTGGDRAAGGIGGNDIRGEAGSAGSGGDSLVGGAAGSAGASGGDAGSSGIGGNAGSSGSGGALACEGDDQIDEPNNSEALAAPVCLSDPPGHPCTIGDRNGNGTTGFGGKLSPISAFTSEGDTDYFVYHGKDEAFAQVDPTAKTEGSGFRLCMFAACESETQSHTCSKGDPTVSPSGMRGCCIIAPGEVSSDHDCSGETLDDDSAHIFIRIDKATACTQYSVDVHF